jgi:taurine dioxygenase
MAVTDHDEAVSARDFTIRPLSPAIGIEVQDIDLTQPLSDEAFAPIRRGWEENCIAVFRGQSLDEAAQVKFASRFGTVCTRTMNDPNPLVRGQHPGVVYVSNIQVDGKLTGILPDGEMFFHSDTCYMECPATASMLFAIEVPSHGGHTLYATASALTRRCQRR